MRNSRVQKVILGKFLLLSAVLLLSGMPAFALITGGGKGPIDDGNWPKGAVDLANLKSRFRWTEGPPFGGGEYRFEYRGGTAAFQKALDALAAIRAPKRELVVCDGPGQMYAVNEDEQRPVDWAFTIWSSRAYYFLYCRPYDGPIMDEDPTYDEPLPPPRIHLYVWKQGHVDWKTVKVPKGIDVVDQRAESAPVKPKGGGLIAGAVYDMCTGKPVPGAVVALEQFYGEPVPSAPAATVNEDGEFRLERIPKGSFYIHASADGYATRLVGNYANEGLAFLEAAIYLAPAKALEGKVVDADGKPVAGVKIEVCNRLGLDGKCYPAPRQVCGADVFSKEGRASGTSDENGWFQIPGLPHGYVELITFGEWQFEQRRRLFPTADQHARSRSNEIRLKVLRSGTVRGRVVVPSGSSLPQGADVRVIRLTDLSIDNFLYNTSVGPDGMFAAPHLLPGEYLVDVEDNARRFAFFDNDRPKMDDLLNAIEHAPGTKRISLKPGETVDVDLTYTP